MEVTAAEYAKQHGISIATARKRLNDLVERGLAKVTHGVIIENRSTKRGARNHNMAIRGNLYRIT